MVLTLSYYRLKEKDFGNLTWFLDFDKKYWAFG
jgi:hypothetical protein